MENFKKWIETKKKIPKCVSVYNSLFKLIKDGEFENEDKLPSEPVLAELMGVSRMTLRQAIRLLQEDGIIKKIQGKGNFFIRNSKKSKRGLETLQHPVYSANIYEIEDVEIEFNIEHLSDYTYKLFGEHSAVLVAHRWYKNGGNCVAYTLTMFPIELLAEKGIDIEDKNKLLEFLEVELYSKLNISKLKIKFTKSMKGIFKKNTNTKDRKSFLLEELIILQESSYFVHNKHYIPEANSNITLIRK